VAAAAALLVAGCGGGDRLALEAHGTDGLTRAQIEGFAQIRIPASARGVHSFYSKSMDTTVLLSFRAARGDVAAFVRHAHFEGRLRRGYRALLAGEGNELGWRLTGPARVAGLEELRDGLARKLMVVYDDAHRPAVYLTATAL